MDKNSDPSILLTGFEPFGGNTFNPSERVAHKIVETPTNRHIHIVTAPVTFNDSATEVISAIEKFSPSVVLCLGQGGGRPDISIERIAINVDDARIPDNKGYQPIDTPIVRDGPSAYFSTLPIKRIAQTLRKNNIPANISNSAGTFVCNHLFYQVSHYVTQRALDCRVGFIHIPYLPEQTLEKSVPSMSLTTTVTAIQLTLDTVMQYKEDIEETGGQIC